MHKATLKALLRRGKMKLEDYYSGVVRSTGDNEERVSVQGAVDIRWGDCLSIGMWMNNSMWKVIHFSPARARIIAQMLIVHADALEERNGEGSIDSSE